MPSTNSVIGIKMMGQLAEDTFLAAMKRNYPNQDAEAGAANMLESLAGVPGGSILASFQDCHG
jgi:hypothetical protein